MIDLHSHVLPGIDDGPSSIDGSLVLARAAVEAGTRTLVATPHVSFTYPNDHATIARLVDELNAQLRSEGIALEVRAGAELAMSYLLEIEREGLAEFGLGGGRWLLVEPPFAPVITGLERLIADLRDHGHSILLAHPERCHAFHRDRTALEALVAGGVLTSITAGSLVGRFGESVRRFAVGLVRDGLVHNVSSDAHNHSNRAPGIARELRQAGLEPLTEWLTQAVPAAILCGGEVPSRPAVLDSIGAEGRLRLPWHRRR